ncbi:MAG: YciI family protein [Lacrimispora sp.]
MAFIYLMENVKPLNKDIVFKHVEYLKELDGKGVLVLCGPFSDYPGGMVVFNATGLEEAIMVANNDPFILLGYKTYQIRTIEVANKSNNYGLS